MAHGKRVAIPEQLFGGRIHEQDMTVAVGGDDGDGRTENHLFEKGLGLFQGQLQIFLAGDITDTLHDIGHLAIVVQNRRKDPVLIEPFTGPCGMPPHNGGTVFLGQYFLKRAHLVRACVRVVKHLVAMPPHDLIQGEAVALQKDLVGR